MRMLANGNFFQVLLFLLFLLLRLVPGLRASDEYDQIWKTAGDKAVCDEMHQLPVQISGSDRLSCQNLCSFYEECGFFTYFNDGSCRVYSACNSTRTNEDVLLGPAEIYRRRWADLTLDSDSCAGNDCQVAVKCPEGYWPIQCEMIAASDGSKNGNGVFLEEDECHAKGSLAGSEIHARITCRRNEKTFTILSDSMAYSDSIYQDQQLVAVSCPSGSLPISCNCVASSAAEECNGKFTFAPIGRTCALDTDNLPGAKITAICGYLATCQSHHCPHGHILKSNARHIFCASMMCNVADHLSCCTPATCQYRRPLNDFTSVGSMIQAGWEFQHDGPTAFDKQLFKLSRCADRPSPRMLAHVPVRNSGQTDSSIDPAVSFYGFDQGGDTVLSLKLTGQGVLALDYGWCGTDWAAGGVHGALEVLHNGNLKYSSASQGMYFETLPESSCYAVGMEPIDDASLCTAAATVLSLGGASEPSVLESERIGRPNGCMQELSTQELFFNTNGDPKGLCGPGEYACICKRTNQAYTSGPIHYNDGDLLQVKGIGHTTGMMLQRLHLMCAAPENLCQHMGGVDCSGELQSWAGSNTCVANVPTAGATCAEYCSQRRLSCVKGMDNDGTKCGLYPRGHFRQTGDGNGCLQRWADQICVCKHEPVTSEISPLENWQFDAEFVSENDQTARRMYPRNRVFANRCRTVGGFVQLELYSQVYIDSVIIILTEKWDLKLANFSVTVDNVLCAAGVYQTRNNLACRTIGSSLRIESNGSNTVCDVIINVIQPDAMWIDLTGMYAYQSNAKVGSRTATYPIDGHSASEKKCTKVAVSNFELKRGAWWGVNLMQPYDIVAVKISGENLDLFSLDHYTSRCAEKIAMEPVDSKIVSCNVEGAEHLKLTVEDANLFYLCEFVVAVQVLDLPVIPLASTSLEDLQFPCSVQIDAEGLLAKFPLRSDNDQSGTSIDLRLKTLMDDRLEASETSYTQEEISFCVASCRKRVACLRVVLTSGECLLYSHGVDLNHSTYSPADQPSICWAEHSLCHAWDSFMCNPELVSTVLASNLSITVPLSKSDSALGSNLSVWQSGLAMAHQDVKLSWVNVVNLGVASRRLHQQRRLDALLVQEIRIEYEIVVPPGYLVPTSGPNSKLFESAFKSQDELAGLDLQVVTVDEWAVIDRNPHKVAVEDTASNIEQGSFSVVPPILGVVACVIVLLVCISGYLRYTGRRKAKAKRKSTSILPVPVGRPSIEDEADYQELDVTIVEALPSSWTHKHTHVSKSFEQMFLMSSDQYDAFRELLKSTQRPICSQDRPCPKPPDEKCGRTRGGCQCVRPGGDPGLPIEYIVRRIIRVEDSVMWSRYIQKKGLLQSNRAGSGEGSGEEGSGEIKPLDPPVFTDEITKQYPDILGPLDSDLNEVFLWHGTTVRGALSIGQKGFDMELAGTHAGNMYGNGIYLAESCTKADEYSKIEQDGHYDGIFALVLCRSCLGKYYYTMDREPEAILQWESGEFDSVCGDRAKKVHTFREMVLYDPDQVYPEYIILYSRRHERDDEAEWQRVAAVPFQTEFPVHWAKCCNDPFDEPFCVQYRVRRDTHDIIQQFLSAACSDSGIDDMTLIAARRVEDSQMWVNYSRLKKKLKARLKQGSRLPQPNELDGNSQAGHVITTTLLHKLDTGNSTVLGNLDESVNELFLWHGTDSSAADAISQVGFQINETFTNGYRYGKGTYLAEDLKKCLSYATVDDSTADIGVQYVLLCRAVCGDIFYTEEDFFGHGHEEARTHGKDCVLGNPHKRGPREFVLMDEKQVYPEFILEIEARGDKTCYMV